MRLAHRLVMVVISVAALACGSTAIVDRGSGGSGQGGSGATTNTGNGGSGASGNCEALTNCCDDATGQEVSWYCVGDEPVCPAGASWPGVEGCTSTASACTAPDQCGLTEYCDFPDNLCGAGQTGTCMALPDLCDDVLDEVCTCGGSIAGNACEGAVSGYDVSNAGGCQVPLDMFACGPKLCSSQTEYCWRGVSDVGGEPDYYGCNPLPACMGSPSCACVSNEPCGDFCELLPSGDVMVTCPGG